MTDERIPVSKFTAMPADTNPDGDIFGGFILGKMDLAAASVASQRAQGRTVTIAIEAMQFIAPVFVGDEVSIYADIEKEGRTSMTIKVCCHARRGHTDEVEKVTEGLFTFVRIGKDRRPKPLPNKA